MGRRRSVYSLLRERKTRQKYAPKRNTTINMTSAMMSHTKLAWNANKREIKSIADQLQGDVKKFSPSATHRLEVERFQDDFSVRWASRVRARADDVGHSRPLINEQRFISIPEPGQIRQPLEVRRHRARVQEKATENQKWNDDRRADAQCHRNGAAGTRYQVSE